jgi:hypothetical protein
MRPPWAWTQWSTKICSWPKSKPSRTTQASMSRVPVDHLLSLMKTRSCSLDAKWKRARAILHSRDKYCRNSTQKRVQLLTNPKSDWLSRAIASRQVSMWRTSRSRTRTTRRRASTSESWARRTTPTSRPLSSRTARSDFQLQKSDKLRNPWQQPIIMEDRTIHQLKMRKRLSNKWTIVGRNSQLRHKDKLRAHSQVIVDKAIQSMLKEDRQQPNWVMFLKSYRATVAIQ